MAKELVQHVWCDACQDRDVQEPATHVDVGLRISDYDKGRAHVMDLCDADYKTIIAPVLEALETYGQRVTGGTPDLLPAKPSAKATKAHDPGDPGPFYCRVPGCYSSHAPFKNASSFLGHTRQYHGLNMPMYRAKYGAPATTRPEGEQVVTCKECGQAYTSADNPRPAQTMAVHTAKAHGIAFGDMFPPADEVASDG